MDTETDKQRWLTCWRWMMKTRTCKPPEQRARIQAWLDQIPSLDERDDIRRRLNIMRKNPKYRSTTQWN